jgi:hypothetical protein
MFRQACLYVIAVLAVSMSGCGEQGPTYDQALQTFRAERDELERLEKGYQTIADSPRAYAEEAYSLVFGQDLDRESKEELIKEIETKVQEFKKKTEAKLKELEPLIAKQKERTAKAEAILDRAEADR